MRVKLGRLLIVVSVAAALTLVAFLNYPTTKTQIVDDGFIRVAPTVLGVHVDRRGDGPVFLELDLSPQYALRISDKKVNSILLVVLRQEIIQQYGFDLALSNALPLNRTLPDYRTKVCREKHYPSDLPVASVIIIFFNEALSTLLRNIVSVLNRTPPHMLGEIILVDDLSTLPELADLPRHISGLDKVRLVRRDVHNGIVGARVRGAQEARHPVIVFLDSHSEVCDGWIEPLLDRIHGDRRRVVVPHIRGIQHQTLELSPGEMWPPSKGSFNWRLSFTIVPADVDRDIEGGAGPLARSSPVRSPVMPGGLFAMDRAFFFELGAYDPEILYYGAEHVELSFRVWMCGGFVFELSL
jgi:polypeptide N-acetylgalactosaminyltransferase